MEIIKILLFPFAIMYGIIMFIRNKMYDWGVFSSTRFDVPIISVGNLSAGGTGKTPHIEYLIRLLSPHYKIATLSRGYGRNTKGYLLADDQSTTLSIGDEPLQFKNKFPNITVSVSEKRVNGVQKILEQFPDTQSILLDDAFQHRSIVAGISIVLSDYRRPYYSDNMLPSGTLREFQSGITRADIIIISKCPTILVAMERKRILDKIKPLPHQKVYFSSIEYGEIVALNTGENNPISKTYYAENNYSVLMVTGIAHTDPLEQYLKSHVENVIPLKFSDHHQYTIKDLATIRKKFDDIPEKNKVIITTEKDAMRLKLPQFATALSKLPIFHMPIKIEFCEQDKEAFNEQISTYVKSNQKSNSVYSR